MTKAENGNGKTVTWKWVTGTLLSILLVVIGVLINQISSTANTKIEFLKEAQKTLQSQVNTLMISHARLEKKVERVRLRYFYERRYLKKNENTKSRLFGIRSTPPKK